MNGFLLIDKPCGPSSHSVVKRVRSLAKGEKSGHSGTLDPQASGLLIVALGESTRLLPYVPSGPKRYRFGIAFGTETDTLDASGKPVAEGGRIPGEQEIRDVLGRFLGTQTQTPPKFSAVKIGGTHAYQLARSGAEFEIKGKTIEIFSLDLLRFDAETAVAECEVACSAGTYVRTLAKDIAIALGTHAHASFIRRVAIGSFDVSQAIIFDALTPQHFAHLVPAIVALRHLPSVVLGEDDCKRVSNGMEVSSTITTETAETVVAYTPQKNVAAIFKRGSNTMFCPKKVFIKPL